MHILTVTTFFPNAAGRQRAVFIRSLTDELKLLVDGVSVIAPIPSRLPFADGGKNSVVPTHENIGGIDVYHPRFLALPKLEIFSGITYLFTIIRTLNCLKKKYKGLVVHGHRIYPDGLAVVLAARLLGIPVVVTAHGSDINRTAQRFGMKCQVRYALKHARAVIAVSSALREKMRRIVDVSIDQIPCAGYSPKIFYPIKQQEARQRLGLGANVGKVVLYVGSMERLKGVELLLDAWQQLHECSALDDNDKLVFAGDGSRLQSLKKKAQKTLPKERVHFCGSISHDQMPLWINAANTLCLPSYMEGTPNVIIESLACAVPVVATAVGGIPAVIKHDENGLLIAPDNCDELANALVKVLSMRWSQDVLVDSVRDYTWAHLARRNYEVMRRVVGAD
ncbi:MAG: glycosyltransferase family 4 protein [Gammaproteobacteria bacterium]|nr:glycosyltransferase family 4 protein [Gammaproteobacteria bacterium]